MEKLLHCKQMLSHLNDQHLFLFAYCVINSYLLCRSASQVKEMIMGVNGHLRIQQQISFLFEINTHLPFWEKYL